MPAAFFVLFFLHVWLRVEPALRYHDLGPVFFLDASFFRPHVTYAGGWADYVAAFLAQLSWDNRLGALVSVALGGLLFAVTRGLLRLSPGPGLRSLPFGPPFLLLLLHNAYDLPVFPQGLALLLALGLGWGYVGQPWSGGAFRLAGCWVGAVLAFYAAGIWSCLVFSAVCCCHEVTGGRRRWLGLGCLSSALVVPLWTVFLPDQTRPVPGLPATVPGWVVMILVVLYVYVPVAILVRAWFARPGVLGKRSSQAVRPGVASRSVVAARRVGWFGRHVWVVPMSLFVLGWLLVWVSLDRQHKSFLEVNYYTEERQWERVLDAGSRLGQMDSQSGMNLVRALYHAGRLPEDLFGFPIPVGFELLAGLPAGVQSCRSQGETWLELGQVNAAEHFAHEALAWEGERPAVLRLLARVNVLLGRPRAACSFLNALRKVPFHRGWAEAALRSLAADPAWPEDSELAGIRGCLVTTDQPGSSISAEEFLRQSLRRNPRNRMAYEYLMAHWLLGLQLDKVVTGMEHVPEYGYRRVPRHYEEAYLLHHRQEQPGRPAPDPQGQPLRAETRQRFARFLESMRRGDLNTPHGRESLLGEFGDTYWVYYLSQQPGRAPSAPAPKGP